MSEFYIKNTSKTVVEMIKCHRILQSGFDSIFKFPLVSCKIISAPNQQEVAWKTMPTFPKNGLWMFVFV